MPATSHGMVVAGMDLRPATLAGLPILHTWDPQRHVREAAGDLNAYDCERELPRAVDWRELLIAGIEVRPIGMKEIVDPAREEPHYWGDVAPNLRATGIRTGDAPNLGRGDSREVMRLAKERCFAPPEVTAIVSSALTGRDRRQPPRERRCSSPRGR